MPSATQIRAGHAYVELSLRSDPFHKGLDKAAAQFRAWGQAVARAAPYIQAGTTRALTAVSGTIRRMASTALNPAVWRRSFSRIATAVAPFAKDLGGLFRTLGKNAAADFARVGRAIAGTRWGRAVAGVAGEVGAALRDVGGDIRAALGRAWAPVARFQDRMTAGLQKTAARVARGARAIPKAIQANLTGPVRQAFRQVLIDPAKGLAARYMPGVKRLGGRAQAAGGRMLSPVARLGSHITRQYFAPVAAFASRWTPALRFPRLGRSIATGVSRAASGATGAIAAGLRRSLNAAIATVRGGLVGGALLGSTLGAMPIPQFGGLTGATGASRQAGEIVSGAGSAMQGTGRSMMTGAAVAGAPLLLGAKYAADFEEQMQMVSTMLDEPEKHMDRFRKGIRNMAISFGEDTGALSKGLYDLLSSSVAPDKALGVLTVTTQAAKAGLFADAPAQKPWERHRPEGRLMEFVRKRKRGQDKKVRRTWFSEEGYRIVWRKEVHGVRVPARFQACVRTLIPYSGGELRQMWDFVNHKRRLIKTLAAAQEECEKHQRFWTKACEAGGVRALRELFGGKLPTGLPLWARKKMDRRLYAILIDNRPMKYRDDEEDESCTESSQPASNAPGPGGPIKTSDSSASPTEATLETATPASSAKGRAESTTRRTRRARSKDTSTSDASTARPAEEAARARKKPVARRTGKRSKRTAKREMNTTGSSASAKPRSHGSQRTKLLPSAS